MSKSISEIVKEKELLEDQIQDLIDNFLKGNDQLEDLNLSLDFLVDGMNKLSKSIVSIELKI